jgi:hypothetical protein
LAAAVVIFLGAERPGIADGLKPEVLRRVVEEREVMTHAELLDLPSPKPGDGGAQSYSFYAATLIHAPLERTVQILTNYALYPKMISYVQRADYDANSHILKLVGGLWGFELASDIRFEPKGAGVRANAREVAYEFVGGHFAGLKGSMDFAGQGERGTLVVLRGSQVGKSFPPRFLITRGAEIVFGYTAHRMRSYVESFIPSMEGEKNGNSLPRPRRHL